MDSSEPLYGISSCMIVHTKQEANPVRVVLFVPRLIWLSRDWSLFHSRGDEIQISSQYSHIHDDWQAFPCRCCKWEIKIIWYARWKQSDLTGLFRFVCSSGLKWDWLQSRIYYWIDVSAFPYYTYYICFVTVHIKLNPYCGCTLLSIWKQYAFEGEVVRMFYVPNFNINCFSRDKDRSENY